VRFFAFAVAVWTALGGGLAAASQLDLDELDGPRYFAAADTEAIPPVLSQPFERSSGTGSPYYTAYFYADGKVAVLFVNEPSGAPLRAFEYEYPDEGPAVRRDRPVYRPPPRDQSGPRMGGRVRDPAP
jgi:hypothetical protein